MSRAHDAISQSTRHYEAFRLNEAASAVYHFLWNDLADWYLEQIKPRLYGTQPGGAAARAVAAHVFDIALRLLHPVMPFITEALWQQLPHHAVDASISTATWPGDADAARDAVAEAEFAAVQAVVTAVRTLRAEYGVAPGRDVHVTVADASDVVRRAMAAEADTIRRLAKAATLDIGDAPPDASGSVVLDDRTTVVVPLGDLVDVDKECARLRNEVARLDERLAAQEQKLANTQFVSRAAPAVVAKEREKLAAWRAQAEALRTKRRALGCAG